MVRIVVVVFFAVAGAISAVGQTVQITDFGTLSSLRNVRATALDTRGRIWAATSGGVFVYENSNTPVKEYRNVNALLTLDATAIFYDAVDSLIYTGGVDGAFDIATLDGSWTNITDISRATQYQRRTLRGFSKKGDTLFIATDFGLLLFNTKKRVFIETIDRIADLQEKTATSGVVLLRDSVWVATDSGMAVAPLNVSTLRLPEVWKVYDTSAALPQYKVGALLSTGSSIIVMCAKQALEFNGAGFRSLATTTEPLNGISYTNGELYVSTLGGISNTSGSLNIPWTHLLQGHTTLVRNGELSFLGYIVASGLDISNGTTVEVVSINSPLSNQFARIAIDPMGGLWVATDVDPPRTGQGVSYFNGSTWKNFNESNTPAIQTRACYRVSSGLDGSVWIGTWGRGGVRAMPDGADVTFTPYTSSNSVLQGIPADPNYVLCGDVAVDRSGNSWVVNEQSASVLVVKISPDGSSTSFPNCIDPGSTLFRTIAVDGAGNKWVGSFTGSGLVAFNERNPESPSDDVCNYIRSSNSQLPDNVINVLKIDKTGALWIGTPKGIAVISAPSQLSSTNIPFVRRLSLLSTAVVNDIYVDALNYKWIATNTGVFVLNEDGTQELAAISTSNAPLLNNNVRCIAIDDLTGTAFFGTSFGCTTAKTSSIKPATDFDITFKPQPYSISKDGQMLIDGLAADADIRIITVGGFLVTAMQTRGKQAVWDGIDTLGRPVPPGVYLLHATSAATGVSTITKFTVGR